MTLIADDCSSSAHWDATTRAKILHRDISLGNIVMMGEDGMLIDWELSKRMDQGLSARSEEKTVSLFTIYCCCPKSIFVRRERSSLFLQGYLCKLRKYTISVMI